MRRAEAPTEIAGRYQLAGRIGAGGMGQVFRARDQKLGRTVALKVLPVDLALQASFIERFLAEAQAAAQISHPNVVQVHDRGEDRDTYYIVMEYVRGKNLRQILAENGRLHPKQAAQVVGQVLAALDAAHERGLVHRDVKPENIIVSIDGRVKVTDFGIARAVEGAMLTGGMLGTVAYVAPEQARGERVDPRADLYSAGCLLYELLTGSLPFEGDAAKVLQEHLNGRVPAPSLLAPEIGKDMDRVVLRSTAPNPIDRYQSAKEMQADLARVTKALPAAAPLSELTSDFTSEVAVETLETMIPQGRRRRRWAWWKWLLATILVVGVAAGIFFLSPIKVPAVVGMDRVDAAAALEQKGLDVRYRREFSDEAEDTVVATRPPPGARVRRGGTVQVTLSAGPELTDAPAVVGMKLQQAAAAIQAAGMEVGNIERRHDVSAKDTVLEQDVKPGRHRKGDPINLAVSEGPQILEIPDVRSRSIGEAESLLRQRGFTTSRTSVFNSAPQGTVVDQSPKAQEKVPQGTPVTLAVSKGPQPFSMPNLKGRACADAKAQLQGLGMQVSVQSPSGGSAACGSNKVLEQDPLPESTVRTGREATLYVG